MEQLKSHLRAGRHECQFYFTYSRAFFVLCLNCFAGCRPRLFCSNSLLSHRTDCRFFQLMLPKWQKSSGSLKLHCLCVIGVGPLSQSASEKHNQETKKPTYLCAPREFPQKICLLCLIIIQSCYCDYQINKTFACSRSLICVSCSVHLISTYYVRKGSWAFSS